MVAHDAPGIENEAFFLLAVPEAVDKDIAVGFAGKDIDPFHHGKGDEVDGLLVPDFVAADAHCCFGCRLNLPFSVGRNNTPMQTIMTGFGLE